MTFVPSSHRSTRRAFLLNSARVSGAAVLGSTFLAACGEDAAPKAGSQGGSIRGADLKFVGWEGYDGTPAKSFPTLASWQQKNDIELSSTYVADNEEMLTKIMSSPAGTYDLTSPYHGTVPTMIDAGAVQPIDTSQLSNWSKIYPYMREQDFLKGPDGEVYAVPFTFSFGVALYNADRVKPLDRFAEVFENSALEGKYALMDAPEQLTWMAVHLGFGDPDPHHITRDELEQVKELAREAVAKSRTVAAGFGDVLQLMIAGEVDYAWTATADQPAEAQAKGANVQAFIAEEGTQAFVDSFCIPKDSPDVAAALAWIDEALSPAVQAEFAGVYSGGVVNPDAVAELPKDLAELYDYNDIESAFDRAPVLPPIPSEGDEFATYADWVKAWNEAK